MTHKLNRQDLQTIAEALSNLLEVDPGADDVERITQLQAIFNNSTEAVITTNNAML